jgi:membrane protein required for colicin V production
MTFFSELTVLDWIVLTIVAGSIVSSVMKGFAREAIALTSTIVGLLMASWFYGSAGSLVAPYVKTRDIASLVGFTLIFLGILLAGAIVSFLVNKFIQAVQLQWFDRLLGAAFGFVRGWVIGSVLFLILTAFPVQKDNVTNAKLGPYLLFGARILIVVTPPGLKTKFLDEYRRIQEFWEGEVNHSTRSSAVRPNTFFPSC